MRGDGGDMGEEPTPRRAGTQGDSKKLVCGFNNKKYCHVRYSNENKVLTCEHYLQGFKI